MRKLAGILFLMLSLVFPLGAWSQTLTIQVKDKYLLGKDIVAYNKPVVQTDLFIPLIKGFYLDLWWSSGFNKNLNGGFDDEIDYTVGWSGEVKNLNLDLGVAYYNLFNLGRVAGDILQPYFEFGKSFRIKEQHLLTPYFRTEIYFPVEWKGVDAKRGALIFGGVKYEWQALEYLTVSQKLAMVYDTGTFIASDRGFLGDYNLALSWKVTEKMSIDLPTFRAIVPLSNLNDGRETKTVFGTGITFKF